MSEKNHTTSPIRALRIQSQSVHLFTTVGGYPTQACVWIIMILWVYFSMEKSPNYQPHIFFDVTCLEHFIQPE